MHKYQIAKYNAYKLIVSEATHNPQSCNSIAKFAKGIEKLRAINADIEIYSSEQEKNITGVTTDTRNTMSKLVNQMLDISGAVYSYALEQSDHALMAIVNYKPTKIGLMNHSELIVAASIVHSEAVKLPAAALIYEGIKPKDLEELKVLIDFFNNSQSSTRIAIIERSGATEKIRELFKEASTLVKGSLDRLATQFKTKDPEFYLKYRAARKVIYSRPQKGAGKRKKKKLHEN